MLPLLPVSSRYEIPMVSCSNYAVAETSSLKILILINSNGFMVAATAATREPQSIVTTNLIDLDICLSVN